MWPTHTLEYYLALKRKEILTHATIRMNFEDTVLSEMIQSHTKKNIVWFHLHEVPRAAEFLERERRMVTRGGEKGREMAVVV